MVPDVLPDLAAAHLLSHIPCLVPYQTLGSDILSYLLFPKAQGSFMPLDREGSQFVENRV